MEGEIIAKNEVAYMAMICPITGEKTLYLDCVECEDKKYCKELNMQQNKFCCHEEHIANISVIQSLELNGLA